MVAFLEEAICWLSSLIPPFWVERHHPPLLFPSHNATTLSSSSLPSMNEVVEPLFDIGPVWAVLSCALLTIWFVGSLYLWPESRTLHRDSPVQIKRRFASIALVCITATMYLYYWARSVSLLPLHYLSILIHNNKFVSRVIFSQCSPGWGLELME